MMMTRVMLILFGTLTIGSLYLTYQGIGQTGVEPIEKEKKSTVRSSSYGSYYGGNSGGFSFGK
jgi:hypothetical protein